jgi:SOS-response transcriptional repressor LexA
LLRRFRPRSEHIELAPYNPDYETKVVPRDRVQIVGAVTETVRPRRH